MPRYIDADALEKKLFPIGMVDDGRYALPAKAVKVAIDRMPTADVIPMKEVERIMKEHIDFRKEEGDVRAEIALEQALSEIIKATKGE